MQRHSGAFPGRSGSVRERGGSSAELAKPASRDCPGCSLPLTDRRTTTHLECRDDGTYRWCTKCVRRLLRAEFTRDAGRMDGISPWCRECQSTSIKARRPRSYPMCPVCNLQVDDARMVIHPACRDVGDQRWCTRCATLQPIARFSRDAKRRGSGGYFPWCKSCQARANTRPQQDFDPENGHHCSLCATPIRGHANRRYCSSYCKTRTNSLSKKYGLEVDEYLALVAQTGGQCPICMKATTSWHVDHDHQTGRVTGVVCSSCNIGALARTFHDPEFIRRLLAYVEDPPAARLGAVARGVRPSNLHTMWGRSRLTDESVGGDFTYG
jgi:hypothetical protein